MVADIAAQRRDRVAKFKKIFTFIKIGAMTVLSVIGSMYFVWNQYMVSEGARQLKRNITPTVKLCLEYCGENKTLVISSVICCVIACAFVAFLVMHGIQTLGERWMMRKANTGGR